MQVMKTESVVEGLGSCVSIDIQHKLKTIADVMLQNVFQTRKKTFNLQEKVAKKGSGDQKWSTFECNKSASKWFRLN